MFNFSKSGFEKESSQQEEYINAHKKEIEDIKKKAITESVIVYKENVFEYALAPNKEKSNLNEKQWLEVRSTNFKNWFGDWEHNPEEASKVLDANGEPLVVSHTSKKDFDFFDKNKQRAGAEYGEGFYFTTDHIQYKGGLGEQQKFFFLNIQEFENAGFRFDPTKLAAGQNFGPKYIVYEPNQIKSAESNSGLYASSSNNFND